MKRRIVFFCLVFHPDSSASSLLFTDLFRRLVGETAEVTVLCGFPSKDSGSHLAALPREEIFEDIHIVRCGLRLQGKRNLAARALAYGSFLVHAGWKLLRLGKNRTVLGGTDPPFTPVALWLLSLTGRVRYQSILLDIYPDGFVGLGTMNDRAVLTRLWRFFNRRSYQRAERLIVIGRDMITLLRRQYGIEPERVTYIPHWGTEEADALPAPTRSHLIQSLGIQDKFVVQYSGNMGLWHDVDSLVRAAERLRDDERIHFLFIGKGRRRQAAEELSHRLGLTNITWLDFLPREELAHSLAACDAALISLRRGLEGVAVPSKLYGILASGRAVIAQVPLESEVAYTVQEEGCGVVVAPEDVDGLAAAIRSLAADPAAARQMGERARAAYRSKYTIEQAVRAFKGFWRLP